MRTIVIAILITTLFSTALITQSLASGFPMRKGKTLLSPSLNYYFANSYRNLSGDKFRYSNEGKYTAFTAQIYLEHGITDRLDLVAKLPLSSPQFKDNVQNNSNTSLGDFEIGLKYNLLQFNKDKYYLTAQALADIPLYRQGKNPSTGYGQFGSELKLMLSGSESKTYFNIEGGYRKYFGNQVGNVSQITYIATSGLYLGKNNQIMGEISGVSSFKSNQFNPLDLASNTEFVFVKANFGIGQRILKDNWIFISLFHDVLNRNSGIGQGASLMGILRF